MASRDSFFALQAWSPRKSKPAGPPETPRPGPKPKTPPPGTATPKAGMRHYELMIIFSPEVDDRTVAANLSTFLTVVTKAGGRVNSVDPWGRRRLAYSIKKFLEGFYAVVDVTAAPEDVIELDRQLNLNEDVLRTKVIRPGDR